MTWQQMAIDHYENFPVGSWLLPSHMRQAIHAIYRFARYADDVADEGDDSAESRLDQLQALESDLGRMENGEQPVMPMMQVLYQEILRHDLPYQAFYDLLKAFKQDVSVKRYESFDDLIDYCRYSANPVGRLVLALHGIRESQLVHYSNCICSALQLINMLQDVGVDWQKDRIYWPRVDREKLGVDETDIAALSFNEKISCWILQEVARVERLMLDGRPLYWHLSGRLKYEIKLIVLSGLRILKKIKQANGNVFGPSLRLNTFDWPCLLMQAMLTK